MVSDPVAMCSKSFNMEGQSNYIHMRVRVEYMYITCKGDLTLLLKHLKTLEQYRNNNDNIIIIPRNHIQCK